MYRTKIRAVNELNKYSQFSHELVFALGPLPSAPSAPSKVIEESTKDSIMVSWPQVTGDDLPLIGYRLYADTGQKDELRLVYDGKNRATKTKFLFDRLANDGIALSPLLFYQFQVTALNFNGESARSQPIALLQTCTAPSQIPQPQIVQVSTATVHLSWMEPVNNGGCPITSYHLYLAGAGVDDPFNEIESANVINQPFLTNYAFDATSLTPGALYKVRVGA